jgi:hypothetical protein
MKTGCEMEGDDMDLLGGNCPLNTLMDDRVTSGTDVGDSSVIPNTTRTSRPKSGVRPPPKLSLSKEFKILFFKHPEKWEQISSQHW